MTSQAKSLKALLKKHNLTRSSTGKLTVRTETRRFGTGGKYREFGAAVAHVRELTKAEVDALIEDDPHLEIFVMQDPRIGYSIIRSFGRRVMFTSVAQESWNL